MSKELVKNARDWAIKKGFDWLLAGLILGLTTLGTFITILLTNPNSRWMERFQGALVASLVFVIVAALVSRLTQRRLEQEKIREDAARVLQQRSYMDLRKGNSEFIQDIEKLERELTETVESHRILKHYHEKLRRETGLTRLYQIGVSSDLSRPRLKVRLRLCDPRDLRFAQSIATDFNLCGSYTVDRPSPWFAAVDNEVKIRKNPTTDGRFVVVVNSHELSTT